MEQNHLINYIKNVLENLPSDWLDLTTHRLDIYNEEKAKVEFIEEFEKLYQANIFDKKSLASLPTAYDYIRLGHPLSSVLEWVIAKLNGVQAQQVKAFSSKTMPILAVLRTNKLRGLKTQLVCAGNLPDTFDVEVLRQVYGYDFELKTVDNSSRLSDFDGQTVLISQNENLELSTSLTSIDFHLNMLDGLGSIMIINSDATSEDISAIQHVRRRESIAMTRSDCLKVLNSFVGTTVEKSNAGKSRLGDVENEIKKITHTSSRPLIGSSGLSIQYVIMMGLIDKAKSTYPDKPINIIVPPNSYGGTNDQARRVAASIDNVGIMDLQVDGDNDMVKSTESVLQQTAELDAIPLVIAEIPTNPRVEVPNLEELQFALAKVRHTPSGATAVAPIFILDQTFCPNYNFLGEGQILSSVKTIAYVSGSKFPSGGKTTAGYLVANAKAEYLLDSLEKHLKICDNEATPRQLEFLMEEMPSMLQRIDDAYLNTRAFVNFIHEVLPEAKINFVSEDLAQQGFRPSVFSLDLPTRGDSHEERETYKRALNLKLINMMITQIPDESKYCVSYGQLKGVYWTIPATSTQGTTKEEDKDYIARVSVSPDLDLEKHKEVFAEFVSEIQNT